ncbi:MAG: exonuclease SbcCD subunit D [Chloroflexi bacterium]|nr:exonuclease SbcCD subunit D [Chloroflexota bacterium]
MRILHFSDLHIGVENYGRIDPATGLSTRLGDFLASLDQVVEYALNEDVDLVLLAGDTYKGRDPSQTHQREFARRLHTLSEAGIPTFLLIGNHDLPNATSRATAVDIFPTLAVPNIYVGDSLQTYTITTKSGPLQIVAVPWPRRGGILSREDSRGLSIDEVREEIETRMTAAIADRVSKLDPNIPAILTAHATISGATTGTERSMMLGQDHVLLVSAVHQPQLEYVALGHVHKHQVLRQDPPMVVYSGSLQRVDFSEEADQKGFCVIELDPTAPQGQRMTDFQFHRVDARPFVTVNVNIDSGELDPTDAVIRAIARQEVANAVVRVRITLPSELDSHLRDADIRLALEGAHYIAAISREVEGTRRTRLGSDVAEGLQPLQAVRLYLESRDMEADRQEKILRYAEILVQAEDDLASEEG